MLETALVIILELPEDLNFPFGVMVTLLHIRCELFFPKRAIVGN